MSLVSTGLSDLQGLGAGQTTNFIVQYDNTLPNQANVIANADALLSVLENEFTVTTGWFNTPGGNFGAGNQQVVTLSLPDNNGANNSGHGTAINVAAQAGVAGAGGGEIVENLFMAEWSEILMSITSTWHAGDSSGEGLSQFCSITRFATGHYLYYGSFVTSWLNGGNAWSANNSKYVPSPNAARSDWVNTTFTGVTTPAGDDIHGDGDLVSFGCALAFIYYLNVQLDFSINQIISKYTGTLASIYHALTGDPGDPFPFFAGLIANVYPASATATLPGPGSALDNPFPLGLLSFWCNNNTFSRDQAADIVASQNGVVSNAFYLILEGFSIASFNKFAIDVPTPTGAFASLPGITVQPSPATPGGAVPAQATPIFEDPANTAIPQRIRFSFDIVFSNEAAFPQSGQAPVLAVLNAVAQIGGATVTGATATAGFELLGGANPYFTNIDPANAADLSYLSQDLRVFSVIAGQSPLPGAPAFTSNAYSSIQNLIGFLNGSTTYNQPFAAGAPDPLNALPGQTGYETADSSVTPTDGHGNTAYNFAIARVRLRGTALDQAINCRVFFRLFVAQSCDTDFLPGTTYKSKPGVLGDPGTTAADVGLPVFPLASGVTLDPSGQTWQTTPYFATDIHGTHDYDATIANANIRTVQIPDHKDQIWQYYGCFLDIYDAAGNANLGGNHHCIVAEIASSDAPIPAVTATGGAPSPMAWDQLAQRNLQITTSENPKSRATHVVPQAFDIRPSKALMPLPGQPIGYPDELMIDWGKTPVGSVATIYWPGLAAGKVLALANSIYASHLLSAADGHTIQCVTTRGVTYIPIPHMPNVNFAGLLTIDLPPIITHGEVFDILVRRVTSRRGTIAPPPPPVPVLQSPHTNLPLDTVAPKVATKPGAALVAKEPTGYNWRQFCGSFNVRIPVTNAAVMLPMEENTLAVLKWRLQTKPAPYRWRPVWERYIELVAARVKGLGGDPGLIPPSLGGYPGRGGGHGHPPHHPGGHPGGGGDHGHDHRYETAVGKIIGVVYDRFGDFDGFDLRTEHGEERRYRAREKDLERLVLDAWRERWVIAVEAEDCDERDDAPPPWVVRLSLRCW